ncbi:proton-conducting transporter membrane subunit [Thermococcus sp.]|uniref:proton-conducting transporter transmembrane domain-containing protein n=1 Tax=Thermococcus sp. TaxID=35749 RepID=UPI0025E7705A|nr:proton-conducting transporter membrane subunit [Thermococcus sp.]
MNPYYLITLGFVLASFTAVGSRRLSYWLSAVLSVTLLGLLAFQPDNIDGTVRYFMLISAIVWLTASLFSVSYDDHYPKLLAGAFSMAIAGMMVILLARGAIGFLIGWEVMTVASYLGITAKEKEGWGAYRFLAFGELSALFILAGFGLLSLWSGSTSFSAWKPSPVWNMAFFLAALGFAVKMAIFPFHIWLPDAHGKAPANLSAQLSAVLTLMGLYGMVRLLLIGKPADWVGAFFLLFGGLTAIIGAAYAAGTEHVKRLPGYSTVENDGILLALFGGTVVALNHGAMDLASFTFLALLFFAFAHSIAKGLLFLIAGRLENGTGRFPEIVHGRLTRIGVVAGYASALSLAGIPPFPGFLGEWLGIESLLQSFKIPDPRLKVFMMLVGSFVALTAGIAGVAMSKMVTHGTQRAAGKRSYSVEDLGYAFSILILFAVGILPSLIFRLMNVPVESLTGERATSFLGGALGIRSGFLIMAKGFGGISPTYLAMIVFFSSLAVYVIVRIFTGGKVRRVRVWSGGLRNPEYPAIAHSAILLVTESWLYGTREGKGKLYWHEKMNEVYNRMSSSYLEFSEWFRHGLMKGSDSIYVAYILLAVMAGLLYLLYIF